MKTITNFVAAEAESFVKFQRRLLSTDCSRVTKCSLKHRNNLNVII